MQNEKVSLDELMKIANSGSSSEDMLNKISEKLSDDKKQKLNDVLSDKSALQKLLSSDEAKKLMEKFGRGK